VPIRWDILTKNQKSEFISVAKRIVRRELPRLKEIFGDNIVSISEGFRTKGKLNRIYRELVIRIYVNKKWAKDKILQKEEILIPGYLSGYMQKGKRRVEIRIPTDVNEIGIAKLQATYVKVSADDIEGKVFPGSICCLVRDTEDEDSLFLLSCKHVFGLAERTKNFEGRSDVKIALFESENKHKDDVATIQKRTDLAKTYPNNKKLSSMDAAIAYVRKNSRNLVSSRINNGARYVQDKIDDVDKFDHPLKIHTKHGIINAKILSTPEKFPVPISSDLTLWFSRIIEYKPSPLTKAGDSGSALLNGTVLVGMHFVIINNKGYAMFAKDIFAPGIFKGRNLKLVTDHNI
jgi:hypothetical protein